MKPAEATLDLEALEVRLLLEGVFQCYGYDFRDYACASIRRRILARVGAEGAGSISRLQEMVLHDPPCMERLLEALTVHHTSMFRDPGFYAALRKQVLPGLRDLPHLRFWDAGCSTGEEAYSLAIVLDEEGLLERSRIYATDLSEGVLQRARNGVFPLKAMREFTQNYLEAGGNRAFSEYYTARGEGAALRRSLQERIVFAPHNLATDGSFNEFHLILCRNVMIYFNRTLQDRVHRLLHASLAPGGILGLGRKESLQFTPHEPEYETVDSHEQLHRKRR
ncbi:MAG: CheR family methyltransferase [Thermoanaerobaculia bacterium]